MSDQYEGKPVFATDHVLGPRRPFEPGERIDRLPGHAVASLLERGLATDDPKQAKAAADGEVARKERVAEQIATRSEKRDHGR